MHWGWVTHLYVCNLTIIGSDNGLSPGLHQAIIWTNAGIYLTHWGRVTHICVTKLTNIGSNNGLSPGRRQAIIWTNAGILLIWPLGTNVNEILIEINTFSLKKMHLKMSSGKWRPSCPGLNVLIGPLGTSVKFYSKLIHFHSRNCIWKCRLQNVCHFVLALMC